MSRNQPGLTPHYCLVFYFFQCVCRLGSVTSLAHADVLEPVGSAVFPVEPGLAIGETAGNAALALGRVGAVEEGNMLIANIAEPGEKRMVSTSLWCQVFKHTYQ